MRPDEWDDPVEDAREWLADEATAGLSVEHGKELLAEIDSLRSRLAVAREALEVYADAENWHWYNDAEDARDHHWGWSVSGGIYFSGDLKAEAAFKALAALAEGE